MGMKRFMWLLALITFTYQHCQGQTNKELTDTANHTFLPSPVPYTFERNNMYVSLPDSLGGKHIKGFAVMEAIINDKGTVQDCNIMKLIVERKTGKQEINYFFGKNDVYNKTSYPKEVERYRPFLLHYLQNLKIVMDPHVKPDEINKFTLMVRFK
jgi:hypothetical protein